MHLKVDIRLFALVALGAFLITSCEKDDVASQSGSFVPGSKSSGCGLVSQNIYPLISDQSISDQNLVQNSLSYGRLCNGALKKLIDNNHRVINAYDLGVLLSFNSPLEDNVLKEVLKKPVSEMPADVVEEILARNLPLSHHLLNEVAVLRPDVSVPSVDLAFDLWLSQNANRLDAVSRNEIISFESRAVQQEIFVSLPLNTRVVVWQERLQSLINSGRYNSSQTTLLNALKNNLVTPVALGARDDFGLPTKHSLFELARVELNAAFEPYEVKLILNELDDYLPGIIGVGNELPLCECSHDSDWCDPFGNNSTSCIDECFNYRPSGCGFFWSYACDFSCGGVAR